MKKLFFILFLVLIFDIYLFSQTQIDSLEAQLSDVKKYKKVEVLNELAQAYLNESPQKAIEYSNKALDLSQELDYIEGEAQALKIIGSGNYYLSNFDKSLEYYLNSLKIIEGIGDKEGISILLNNIGIIYWKLNNFDKALEIYTESLEIMKEMENKEGISRALNNIGLIYMTLENYDEALEYFLKSLKIVKEINNKNIISYSLNNIGIIYWYLADYDKALEYYLESLEINKEINNKYGIAGSTKNIGGTYLKLKNYYKSLAYLKKGLKLAKEIGAKDLIQNIYASLTELYVEKANYKEALEYYQLYSTIKDSIFTEESSNKIAEMQTKYETEKKEKENEILKKDNKIQKLEINKQQNLRNSFIVISILILFLAFVIYARYRSKQKTNIILNQKNTEIENANTELNRKNKQITKQKNQLSGTLNELRETQKMLTDTAHRAGMAEIATGILHNVGNVLNSVKVSSQLLKEKIISSKVNNLQKVLSLMEEHSDNIGEFITSDDKGKMLPEYLVKVGVTLKEEQDNSLKELSTLHNGINHIEEIIAVQQSYVGVTGLVEKVALSEMMDDVLKMHSEMFRKYKIKITKKYSKTKPILIEKGKLIQVFVNLLKNSKESLETKDDKNRVITINILEDKQHQTVEILDNGAGISKENLTRIFSYGFSTKKEGKGFGLHTSALAMNEMKGKLNAESKGDGKGAKFIVSIPV
ncbi:MAG: tetratricopeptide repeat-containing sensor histidine kinase [Candidatus Cloacimonetes bacterium]|nr:tetratricopeptide repeat-containing sensor histidine kinase [Candidatus Cloacimonadota bacterium]